MKSFFSFLSKSSQKKILCLDGGGVRTIAALVFLKKLESESGKKVTDIFDMFIGTSAGSLNAACFAYGDFSAEKVKNYWSKKYLDRIMKSSFFWDKASLIQARPRYENDGRINVLNEIFKDNTLDKSKKPFLCYAYDIEKRTHSVFDSFNTPEITFKDVNFSYEIKESSTLNSVNLEFKGGKMTSLVGHSGSGKSTILNLIPRFYDIQSGVIMIDDQSIYKSTIRSIRKEISMVSQETTLFDDTIKNNIKYAREDADDEEVYKVAKLSFCEEFINKLPNKFETLIGENGVRLSGGEKQRLSIARAMLKKSSIILLDEATSSLDSETESKIQEALKILTKDKTTIVIAHRLSTILNSNNIYVIDSGNVVDSGQHDQLIAKSALYKKFYEKQIQK